MNRQKMGKILFWLGIVLVFVMQALTWIQTPTHQVYTAEELDGTIHAIWGPLFWIRNMGGNGLAFSLMGVLLYTSKKGSKFWLWGILPTASSGLLMTSSHISWLFGLGGTVILLSYFGILWLWTKSYSAYEATARTGKHIQLLGYSFLVTTGLLLCMYFGNPEQPALADLPLPSGLSINVSLSLSMLLLFMGQYLVVRGTKENRW